MTNRQGFAASVRALFLGVAVAVLPAANATAVTIGYTVGINDPEFNAESGSANVPDLQIENTSDAGSGIEITDLVLTIGDTDFNFDFVRIETAFNDPDSDLGFTRNAPDLDNDGIGTDALDYDFTGFGPGDIFRIEVDIDPDAGNPVVDFRDIMFPSATLSLTFSDGQTLSETLAPLDLSALSFEFAQSAVAVPLPNGLALYFGALAAGGLLMRHRRRRAH